MNIMTRQLIIKLGHLICVLYLLISCISFNDNPNNQSKEVIGLLGQYVDLRSHALEANESAVGNLVADSICAYAQEACVYSHTPNCPDFCLINSGALRRETPDGLLDTFPPGPVFSHDIDQLLPFPNGIVVVRLKGIDVKNLLEHAVSHMGNAASANYAHQFLQISGIEFDVDCSPTQEREHIYTNGTGILKMGTRVSNIVLNQNGQRTLLDEETHYRVATTTYLANGNDGYLSFLQLDEKNSVLTDSRGNRIAKYNPQKDVFRNEQGLELSTSHALYRCFQKHRERNEVVFLPETGRIHLHNSCQSN